MPLSAQKTLTKYLGHWLPCRHCCTELIATRSCTVIVSHRCTSPSHQLFRGNAKRQNWYQTLLLLLDFLPNANFFFLFLPGEPTFLRIWWHIWLLRSCGWAVTARTFLSIRNRMWPLSFNLGETILHYLRSQKHSILLVGCCWFSTIMLSHNNSASSSPRDCVWVLLTELHPKQFTINLINPPPPRRWGNTEVGEDLLEDSVVGTDYIININWNEMPL